MPQVFSLTRHEHIPIILKGNAGISGGVLVSSEQLDGAAAAVWSHRGPSSPPRSKMTSSVVQEDSCNRRDDGCGAQLTTVFPSGKTKQKQKQKKTFISHQLSGVV